MTKAFCLFSLLVLFVFVPVAQAEDVADDAVQKAIDKGVEFLWRTYNAGGGWGAHGDAGGANFQPDGPTALVLYALLESGVSVQDERMAAALKWLQQNRSDRTYSLGLRCQVWELASRTNKDYMVELRKDVAQLVASTTTGAYSYPSTGTPGKGGYDNSNSQYGILGVWAGIRSRPPCEVPRDYWLRVMKHWIMDQDKDGKWYYTDSTRKVEHCQGTMTVAGIASMFVCFDQLFADAFIKCESTSTEFKPIQQGLDWLEKNFASVNASGWKYYFLYGVERVGLASGYKYFGTTDWYKHGVEQILKAQDGNGAVGGSPINTAFSLLFLIRGQRPVLFNKMQYEGDWNNRPRALASLTEWLNRTYEVQTNWQIINLKVPVSEWHDAPILYFSGCREPKFSEEEIKKIKRFVLEGGTIFTCTEGSGAAFSAAMKKLYIKLFPQYELTPCKSTHEVYNLYFKVNPLQAPMAEISNRIRPLVIHTDKDLPVSWQVRNMATQRYAYEAAANVFMYVTDKGSLRHRGVSLWPEGVTLPSGGIKVARLKFKGSYDPEPLAFERFALLMAKKHNVQVDVSAPLDIASLTNDSVVAILSGTGEFWLTPEEKAALKKYVAGGGYLLVTAAGGSPEFAKSGKALIEELFPEMGPLRQLAGTAPLYAADFAPTMKIDAVKYRRKTKVRLGPSMTGPSLRALLVEDKPVLFFSQEDIVAGLVGYPSYNCDGYDPDSSFAMMRNIVMYASKNKAPTGAPKPAAK